MPEIAVPSGRAPSTVRTHLKGIHRKLGVSRRADLVGRVLSVPARAGTPSSQSGERATSRLDAFEGILAYLYLEFLPSNHPDGSVFRPTCSKVHTVGLSLISAQDGTQVLGELRVAVGGG